MEEKKVNKHKKIYEPPRVIGVFKTSPVVLSGVSGNGTPGEDQGGNGGSLAKPHTSWEAWDDDDFDDNEKPKTSKAWEGGDTW